MVHRDVACLKASQRSFIAASSLGSAPLVLRTLRSWRFRASMTLVV